MTDPAAPPVRARLITVIRREADDKESVPFHDARLSDILNGKVRDIVLKPNDIVRIQPDRQAAAIGQLFVERTVLQTELNQRSQRLGSGHVEIVELRQRIKALDDQIKQLADDRSVRPTTTTRP